MLSASAEPACLLIADISGYTSYLAGVELDHAQDILADLMNTVVTTLRPAFKLAKLEGDAAFVFAPAEKVDASMLLDTVERCYFGFRRRRRDVRQATSCECNACLRIPDLNLKFVAHHGLVLRQKIAGREELLGSDVIVVHRLLKNSIVSIGRRTPTPRSARRASMPRRSTRPRWACGAWSRRTTTSATSRCWVLDLEARWQEEEQRKRVFIGPEAATFSSSTPTAAPPQLVWEFLTTPGRRRGWQHGVTDVIETPAAGGRRGVGTVNHCMHGPDLFLEEILDWRPWDYLTDRTTIPGGLVLLSTFELEPTPEGTIVHFRVKPERKKDLPMLEQFGPMLSEAIEAGVRTLQGQVLEEATARAEARAPSRPCPSPSLTACSRRCAAPDRRLRRGARAPTGAR